VARRFRRGLRHAQFLCDAATDAFRPYKEWQLFREKRPSSVRWPRNAADCIFTSHLHFSQPKRREEFRRGRHEYLRHDAEYTLSYGIAAQTSRPPRWQSDGRTLRNILRNTG
jgi:hypothetical protein